MDNPALVAKFSAAIERAYSIEAKPADNQADFDRWYPQFAKAEYDTAIQIISRVNDASLLNALRDAYLKLYAKYAANRLNVHFARSDQTFFELFERTKKASTKDRNLLSEWAALLDDKKDTPLKKRFQELSPTYQTKVRALIPKPPAPVKTILDFLRDEFQKQREYAPGSNADLYDFDPYQNETLRLGLQGNLASVQTAWKACLAGNEDMPRNVLHGTLDGYRKWLATVTRQGLLPLFQVIKYLQDRIFIRRENMGTWTRISGGDKDPVTCELYAMACLQLLKHAQGELVLPSNRETLTKEEQQYFLRPLREAKSEYFYYSNIADRLSRPLGNVTAAFDLSKNFLDLILLTKVQVQGATLVHLGETHRIQAIWKPYRDLGEKLKDADAVEVVRLCTDPENVRIAQEMEPLLAIEVPLGKHDLGIAYARVGASPGVHKTLGKITIIHIDPKNWNDFYIEFEPLRPNLFQVHKDYITHKVYGSRIFGVHKSTIGIVYVVQGMFMMMGFMPAFVEAGFAGLIYEIATWYVSSKIGEQAAKIHPVFGHIVEFAAQIAMPRPKFGPKIVEPPSTTRFERPRIEIVERKGIPAEQARGVRQADSSWLDRNLSGVNESQRAVSREPATAKPVAAPELTPAPASPKPALAEPIPSHAGRGEPPRPGWKHQGLQQQKTQVKPPEPSASTAKPVSPSRPRQQEQPVGQRIRQPETPAAKATTAKATAESSTSRKGIGDRGVGERPQSPAAARGTATPNPPVWYGSKPIAMRSRVGGLTTRMKEFVARAATIFREEIKRLQDLGLNIRERSIEAHKNAQNRLRKEYPDVTEHGEPLTGITGPASAKGQPNVRVADSTYVDPTSPARETTPADLNIEFKHTAYPTNDGRVLHTSGGRDPNVTSEQIQAYEVGQRELGVPTFVINGRGEIYGLSRGRWTKVGGPE